MKGCIGVISQIITQKYQIDPVKALAVNPLYDKEQIFALNLYTCLFPDFPFNRLGKHFLTVLASAG